MPLDDLMHSIAAPPPVPDVPALEPAEQEAVIASVFAEMIGQDAGQPPSSLYQDFQLRCRMRGVTPAIDLATFRKRLAVARAGLTDGADWEEAISLGASLPEEMLAPFLALARAGRGGEECPSDAELASLYGTSSAARARRMLSFVEEKGLIVCRTDLSGRRSISLPHLGWTTAASMPDPARPSRMARIAAREPRSSSAR
jgi:hypothetical protein